MITMLRIERKAAPAVHADISLVFREHTPGGFAFLHNAIELSYGTPRPSSKMPRLERIQRGFRWVGGRDLLGEKSGGGEGQGCPGEDSASSVVC